MLDGGQEAPGPVSPSPEGCLGISACLWSAAPPAWCGAGPVGAGLGAGTGSSGCLAGAQLRGMVALGGLGTRCSPCAPLPVTTLPFLISAIYSEVYFLYQVPSPARQELMGAHWEKRPCSWALSACSMDTNHSAWWDRTLQPPSSLPGAAVVLPAVQCWEGARDMPVTLGWAGGMGTAAAGWYCFVLFFGHVPHVCPTVAGAG